MEHPFLPFSMIRTEKLKCKNCKCKRELSVGLVDVNRKLLKRKEEKNINIDKLKALISVAEEKLKRTTTDKLTLDDSFSQVKGIALSSYFSELRVPNDFFSIVTREEFAIAFLLQSKFLPYSVTCQKCNIEMKITYYGFSGYIYYCFQCNSRNKLKNVTCFQSSPLNIEKILLFIFFWVLGIRDLDITNLLETSNHYTSVVSRKIRQLVGEEYVKDLPQFSGIVEIDELDFIKKKIEIGKSKISKK